MNTKHFKLTDETRVINDITLYRNEALIDLPHHNVKKGDLSDCVFDNAWVADIACVLGDAWVTDNAWISLEI